MRTDAPHTDRRPAVAQQGDRHRNLTEGLTCEPLLAVPVTLALLSLATFVIALVQLDAAAEAASYWITACVVFTVVQVLFAVVYDSPRRHAVRVARGCPHIRPHRAGRPVRRRTPRR